VHFLNFTHILRTNIDIEDALIADGMAAGPVATKKDAVEAGLKLLKRQAETLLLSLAVEATGSAALCLQAVQHFRDLRRSGVTVRSGINVLVAAFCIERDHLLLRRDRDFTAFETLRGLRGFAHGT
jgi:Arc/MetJ family transcription regulator